MRKHVTASLLYHVSLFRERKPCLPSSYYEWDVPVWQTLRASSHFLHRCHRCPELLALLSSIESLADLTCPASCHSLSVVPFQENTKQNKNCLKNSWSSLLPNLSSHFPLKPFQAGSHPTTPLKLLCQRPHNFWGQINSETLSLALECLTELFTPRSLWISGSFPSAQYLPSVSMIDFLFLCLSDTETPQGPIVQPVIMSVFTH